MHLSALDSVKRKSVFSNSNVVIPEYDFGLSAISEQSQMSMLLVTAGF